MIDIHNLVRSNKNKNFDAIASLDTAPAKYLHRRYDIRICCVQKAIIVAFLNISSAPQVL